MANLFKSNNIYIYLAYFILSFFIIILYNSKYDSPKQLKNSISPNNIQKIKILGDINQFTPHILTLSILILKKDISGLFLYSKIIITSLISTYIVKYTVKRLRPNKALYSFPSGHSSFTFISFIFLLFRFNFKYSILPLILSIFVGYSRVVSNYHYTSDVLAGFLLSFFISHIFFLLYNKNNST